MKHFVLSTLVIFCAVTGYSQVTYTTAASGNFSSDATWVGGNLGKPPQNNLVVCDCKIVVSTGHSLTIDQNTTLNRANFVLNGANSVLGLANNTDLTLQGVSSIDVQDPQARVFRATNTTSHIILGGQTIFTSNSTKVPSTAPAGTVQGLASASSARANPQFQSGTLPVKLSEFKVSSKGSGVAISWKTDLEINSSHFEVERSGDSKEWKSIGSVQASGNVSVEQSYSYTDASPLDGTNYYRLKMIDLDGQFDFSPIKSVSFASTALNIVAAPNPATSFLTVSVTQPGRDPYRLRLINRAGQVVFDQKYAAANNRVQLSVANYADGSYFLEITNNSGMRQINKVMIVRK